MFKNGKLRYVIKAVASDDAQGLQNLLNEMSDAGWDLYSMHEIEVDEGFQFNCIFVTEAKEDNEKSSDDEVLQITNFKTQMEKMLSAQLSPYETCRDIQSKIKEKKNKVSKIKSKLEGEAPASKERKKLNDEMSKGLKELEELKQNLIRVISPDLMFSQIGQEKLSIHLSEEILDFVNPEKGADLLSETVKVRQKLTDELGYVLTKIVFQDDDKLTPYEFSINIRGLDVLKSFVYPDYLMFFEEEVQTGKKIKDAIYSEDPITGKKIVWMEKAKTKSFWAEGLTPPEYIARALEFCAIKHVDELLDYNDINMYMDIVTDKNLFLVDNIIPDFISVSELRYLLASLIREEISIKDIVYIFEKINDFSDEATKEDLYDKIRLSLSRYICKKYVNAEGVIQGLELSEKTIDTIFSKTDAETSIIRIDGIKIEKLAKKILTKAKEYQLEPLIVFAPLEGRHMTYTVLSQFINNIKVLAKEEISSDCAIETIDII